LEENTCTIFIQNFIEPHQALKNLNSAQLINNLFNKEHNQDSMDTAISQQVRHDLEEYDKWKLVMPRRPKLN
jgi:hypothetical protein